MSRTRKLGYNRKLSSYRRTQQDLRTIHRFVQSAGSGQAAMRPIDLEVVVAEPRWLCGTIAFHPMLGYRRERQAQSIAHGCATTMLGFARFGADEKKRPWISAWGMEPDRLPVRTTFEDAFAQKVKAADDGICWLTRDSKTPIRCPFSKAATSAGDGGEEKRFGPRTRKELDRIYRKCHKRSTHGLEK